MFQKSLIKQTEELNWYANNIGLDDSFLSTKPETMEALLLYIENRWVE